MPFKNTLPKLLQTRILLYVVFVSSLFPLSTYAQAVRPVPNLWCSLWGIRCGGGAPLNTLWGMLWSVVTIALSFVAIVATAFLVYYGFLYVMSRGEEDNARRAKAGIVYAILGMIVAGTAAWLVNAVINI